MLKMMKLKGLTNFGKGAGGGERRGDLGSFVTARLIWEFKQGKKKDDVVETREVLLRSQRFSPVSTRHSPPHPNLHIITGSS